MDVDAPQLSRWLRRIVDGKGRHQVRRIRAPLFLDDGARRVVALRDLEVHLDQAALGRGRVPDVLDPRLELHAHDRVGAIVGDRDGIEQLRRGARGDQRETCDQPLGHPANETAMLAQGIGIPAAEKRVSTARHAGQHGHHPPELDRWRDGIDVLIAVSDVFVYT